MRLLFNATNLSAEGGVALLSQILQGFLEFDQSLYILLLLNPALSDRLKLPENSRVEVLPFRPAGRWKRFWWEQWHLPRRIRGEQIDVLFSFGNTGPLFPGCRQILYLQQAIPYSEYRPQRHWLRWRAFQLLYGFLMDLAQLGSARIIVPTGWLVDALRRSLLYLKPESAYRVTLPGVPDMPGLPEGVMLAPNEIALLENLERWRAAGEKILIYPCALAPYKNIPWLLTAFSQAGKEPSLPPHRLVLTFDENSPEAFPCKQEVFEAIDRFRQTHGEDRLVLSGALCRFAMAEAYRRADILVFPSLVETLGLPLLEAMAHGLAIAAVQSEDEARGIAEFAKEICGDAAVYAPPDDLPAFAAQIARLLKDDLLAYELGRKGVDRAWKLSWPAHVRHILAP